MTDQVQDQAVETTETPVELTLSDLGQLGAIIDLATQRGAFKAAELTAVGGAYDKLSSFLASVTKHTQDAVASEVEAESEAAA